ncbi:hypothetical protein TorRG33x02_138620 [Trema orientale]|uniref:Uncharacterized protein n=1 Tax=Trema orientale TaxID=63057 RepID=A0A2P5EXX6_TREOI|nr:hypothetical protein TorRG33x02_138620 [Trema orientale]
MAGLDGLNRQSRNQSECAVWPIYQSVRFEFVDSNRPNRTYIFEAGLGGFRDWAVWIGLGGFHGLAVDTPTRRTFDDLPRRQRCRVGVDPGPQKSSRLRRPYLQRFSHRLTPGRVTAGSRTNSITEWLVFASKSMSRLGFASNSILSE